MTKRSLSQVLLGLLFMLAGCVGKPVVSTQMVIQTATVAPTFAPTDTETPTPAPSTTLTQYPTQNPIPTEEMGNFQYVLDHAAMNTKGNGTYLIEWKLVNGKGRFSTKSLAYQSWQTSMNEFFTNCHAEDLYPPQQTKYFSYYHHVSTECFETLEKITGMKATDKLPAEVVDQLMGEVNTPLDLPDASQYLLYFGDAGEILGKTERVITQTESIAKCDLVALKYLGWESTGFFHVRSDNEAVWEILKTAAIVDVPIMPDFCGQQYLKPTYAPYWIKAKVGNDQYEYDLQKFGMKVTIHTDPNICTKYYRGWETGKYLVEISSDEKATLRAEISDHDLIKIVVNGQVVYLAVANKIPQFYKSSGDLVSSIEIYDVLDGSYALYTVISPNFTTLDPYYDGKVINEQNFATMK